MSNAPGDVDAGHLGRLAAEQRAAGRLARLGHAADDVGDEVGVERAGGDVVEEEQRPGALHEHVADAVVDDVHADAADRPSRAASSTFVPTPSVEATRTGSSSRQRGLGAERAAEAADAAEHRGAVGALDARLELGDGPVALVDVDAGRGVRAERGARAPASRCRGAPACRRTRSSPSPS